MTSISGSSDKDDEMTHAAAADRLVTITTPLDPHQGTHSVPSAAPVMHLDGVSVFYGTYEAVRGTTLPVRANQITAMIGPSGCGKSTILRSLNRMNDLIPGAVVRGSVTFHGQDLYAKHVDP